jgi:hypothetical protein
LDQFTARPCVRRALTCATPHSRTAWLACQRVMVTEFAHQPVWLTKAKPTTCTHQLVSHNLLSPTVNAADSHCLGPESAVMSCLPKYHVNRHLAQPANRLRNPAWPDKLNITHPPTCRAQLGSSSKSARASLRRPTACPRRTITVKGRSVQGAHDRDLKAQRHEGIGMAVDTALHTVLQLRT